MKSFSGCRPFRYTFLFLLCRSPTEFTRVLGPRMIRVLWGHCVHTSECSPSRIFRMFSAPVTRMRGLPKRWVLKTFPCFWRLEMWKLDPCYNTTEFHVKPFRDAVPRVPTIPKTFPVVCDYKDFKISILKIWPYYFINFPGLHIAICIYLFLLHFWNGLISSATLHEIKVKPSVFTTVKNYTLIKFTHAGNNSPCGFAHQASRGTGSYASYSFEKHCTKGNA